MSLFQNILGDISKKLQKSQFSKEVIVITVSKTIGFNISTDDIYIKNQTIYFNVSPTIKSIITLKQNLLLKELESFSIKSIG
mgnify:CR=1 FL=1